MTRLLVSGSLALASSFHGHEHDWGGTRGEFRDPICSSSVGGMQLRGTVRRFKVLGPVCKQQTSQSSNAPKRRKENVWSVDFQEQTPKTSFPKNKKNTRSKTKSKSSHNAGDATEVLVTEMFTVDQEEVLQAEELIPSPLWNTFASNNRGVWKGVGAVFSPMTAKVQPLGLGSKNEYLYDCRIVDFVEPVTEKRTIDREILWKVENPYGEKSQGKIQVQDDLVKEDVAEEEFIDDGTDIEDIEDAIVSDGEDEFETENGVEDGAEDLETDDDVEDGADDLETDDDAEHGADDLETDDGAEDGADDFETDDDAEDGSEDEEEATEAEEIEYASDDDESGLELEENLPEPDELPAITSKYSHAGIKDVMEKDSMAVEPGLVFFEDGAYSRGPSNLLRPKDDPSITRGYYYSPTFKIEQCLVRGGHKRVRIVHTISVYEETEEVEVVRVAVYEEEWMGPVHSEGIRESSKDELKLLSQRPRLPPRELAGTWKVFEVNASVSDEQDKAMDPGEGSPAPTYACKEFRRTKRQPRKRGNNVDVGILWLTGGLFAYVDFNEAGMRIGAGWYSDDGTSLIMERDYDPDGKLVEVKSQTEIREAKSMR